MNNQKLILIYIGIALLLVVLWFSLFERKEVSDVDWDAAYHINSKKPQDLWLLHSLLSKKYNPIDENEIEIYEEDSLLIVIVDKYVRIGEVRMKSVLNHVSNGATLLLSSIDIDFDVENPDNIELIADTIRFEDSIGRYKSIRHDAVFPRYNVRESIMDSTHRLYVQHSSVPQEYGHKLVDYVLADYIQSATITTEMSDSIFKVVDSISMDMDSIDIVTDSIRKEASLEEEVITVSDTLMKCYQYDNGMICYHNTPQLFMNIGSFQDYYLPHFDIITSKLDATYVSFKDFSTYDATSSSPLKYILEQRSFRWAYYLLLLLAGLYVYFGGKRKQREIPLLNPKQNNSMEFIHTVSRLYKKQNRHDRLALKIKANFMSFVEDKYYLFASEEEFWQKLEKKSKVKHTEIIELEKQLNKIYHHMDYSNKELAHLHQIINQFFKNTKI